MVKIAQNCIYNTDPEWAFYLRRHNICDEANFWKKAEKTLRLMQGDFFYFKLNRTQQIIGRARYHKVETHLAYDVWQKFKERNGVATEQEFFEKLSSILHINDSQHHIVQCVILRDIQWLDTDRFCHISESLFPKKVEWCKYFTNQEIKSVISCFPSRL
jgi:hypothetical protein